MIGLGSDKNQFQLIKSIINQMTKMFPQNPAQPAHLRVVEGIGGSRRGGKRGGKEERRGERKQRGKDKREEREKRRKGEHSCKGFLSLNVKVRAYLSKKSFFAPMIDPSLA